MKFSSVFQSYALSRNVEEYLKKILDPDPDADDFQYLLSSSLTMIHEDTLS